MHKQVTRALRLGLAAAFISTLGFSENAPDPRATALRLYRTLTGVPLSLEDPRLARMEAFIRAGTIQQAAEIATDDKFFYQLTVKHFATPLSNRDRSPYAGLNDFTAMVIGVTRDGRDARTLLSGNFGYAAQPQEGVPARSIANNNHYEQLEARGVDLKAALVRVTPQWGDIPEAAGLLTSRAWSEAHFTTGTNRRAVERSIDDFLCTPITAWRESDLDDTYVRRDVDRQPGGVPETYQGLCRGCHAGMDAFGGAFARFDFVGGRLVRHANGVAAKYRQNVDIYRDGYITHDDYWTTLRSSYQQRLFGWRGDLEGRGLQNFGRFLADSHRFKSCMTERVFRELCSREATPQEKTGVLARLAQNFERNRFRLRSLFEEVAILPNCLGNNGGPPGALAVSHFAKVNETLGVVTRISPATREIANYYQEVKTRLPRDGLFQEITTNALVAITALSGLYCKHWVAAEQALRPEARRAHGRVIFNSNAPSEEALQSVIANYGRLFWQREPTNAEKLILLEVSHQIRETDSRMSVANLLQALCTTVASSLYTFAQ